MRNYWYYIYYLSTILGDPMPSHCYGTQLLAMRQHRPLCGRHEFFEGIHQISRGAVADCVGFDAEAIAFQMAHGLDRRIIPLSLGVV